MFGMFTDFWRIEVSITTTWTQEVPIYDLFIDGEFIREIYGEEDLNPYERRLLVQDKIAFFLWNFPGNIITSILEWNGNKK